MAEEPGTNAAPAAKADPEIDRVLLALGRVFESRTLYGPKHPSVARVTQQAFDQTSRLLSRAKKLNLSVNEGLLMVDGRTITSTSPFIVTLRKRIEGMGVSGFTLNQGITLEEFAGIVDVMATGRKSEFVGSGQGGSGGGFANLSVERVVYARVREGEVVVDGKVAAAGEALAAAGPATVQRVAAFLAGDPSLSPEEAGEALRELGGKMDELADALAKRAAAGATAGSDPGQTLSDLLRRLYEGYRDSPVMATEEGRLGLKKSFEELKDKLRLRMAEQGVAWTDDVESKVQGTIAAIASELEAGPMGMAMRRVASFLAGDGKTPVAETGEALKSLAEEVGRLAEVLAQRAAAGAAAAGGTDPGQTLADLLQKLYDGYRETELVDTKKGRTQLKKAFQDLKDKLRDKLVEAQTLDWTEDVDGKVKGAIGEISAELEVETLVTDHERTRVALDRNEERLLRYLRRSARRVASLDPLRDRLVEAGLPLAAWGDLVARSGLAEAFAGDGPGGGAEGTSPSPAAALSLALEDLDRSLAGRSGSPEEVQRLLERVSQRLTGVASVAERMIDELAEITREEAEAGAEADGVGPGRLPEASRRRLSARFWEIMSELGQEFIQPLTVVSATLSMLIEGYVGTIDEEQRGLLRTAEQSAARLKALLDRFVQIVGYPRSRKARAEIIGEDETVQAVRNSEGAAPAAG